MSIFVDTSALVAVLDADDQNHLAAAAAWQNFVATDPGLVCSNYIFVETLALIQSRLGTAAVRAFQADLAPMLQVDWIDAQAHARSVTALLIAGRQRLSLVDCSSFEAMRESGINEAFTFDRHFAEQGFICLPAAAG